jgi:hypothetical protein
VPKRNKREKMDNGQPATGNRQLPTPTELLFQRVRQLLRAGRDELGKLLLFVRFQLCQLLLSLGLKLGRPLLQGGKLRSVAVVFIVFVRVDVITHELGVVLGPFSDTRVRKTGGVISHGLGDQGKEAERCGEHERADSEQGEIVFHDWIGFPNLSSGMQGSLSPDAQRRRS